VRTGRLGWILLATTLPWGARTAQRSAAPETLKVKIEAPEWDKKLLLEKLQSLGTRKGLNFEMAETGFDYRIVFETGQQERTGFGYGVGVSINASSAGAKVYDSKGAELFQFERRGRFTDVGATNAVAKEVVKRLVKLRGGGTKH
jgi:hypothetical protein